MEADRGDEIRGRMWRRRDVRRGAKPTWTLADEADGRQNDNVWSSEYMQRAACRPSLPLCSAYNEAASVSRDAALYVYPYVQSPVSRKSCISAETGNKPMGFQTALKIKGQMVSQVFSVYFGHHSARLQRFRGSSETGKNRAAANQTADPPCSCLPQPLGPVSWNS